MSDNLPCRTPADDDLADMDDIEFLAMVRAVRETKESMPQDQVPPELQRDFARVNREFMRRAGMAWRNP
jgi:hypothetical protein